MNEWINHCIWGPPTIWLLFYWMWNPNHSNHDKNWRFCFELLYFCQCQTIMDFFCISDWGTFWHYGHMQQLSDILTGIVFLCEHKICYLALVDAFCTKDGNSIVTSASFHFLWLFDQLDHFTIKGIICTNYKLMNTCTGWWSME